MNKSILAGITFAAGTILSLGAVQAQDAAAGERVFKKCAGCHTLEAGKRRGAGPSLHGVVGGAAGAVENYKYSSMLAAAGEAGLVWDEATLMTYLADPNAFLKSWLGEKGVKTRGRSKMSFRLTKEQEQKDVIAYLESAAK